MYKCEFCGKESATPQGLRGHKTFQHGLTKDKVTGGTTRLEATEQPLFATTQQRLLQLEQQFEDLVEQVGELELERNNNKVPAHSHTCEVSRSDLQHVATVVEKLLKIVTDNSDSDNVKLLAVALWEHSHEGSDDKLVMLPSDSHDKVADLAGMPKTKLPAICTATSKCSLSQLRKDGWCNGKSAL